MSGGDDLERDYRAALLQYLPRHEEAALHRGYRLGRAAVGDGVSLLELARVHHTVFLEVLRDTPAEELPRLTAAAGEFLLEVLATYDMTQRQLREG